MENSTFVSLYKCYLKFITTKKRSKSSMEVYLWLLNSNLHIHILESSLKVIKYPCNTYICHVAQNSTDGHLDCMKNVWNIYSQFWPCIMFHCSLPKAKEVVCNHKETTTNQLHGDSYNYIPFQFEWMGCSSVFIWNWSLNKDRNVVPWQLAKF